MKKLERLWLRQIRETREISQSEMARRLNRTQACYCQIESGARNPTVALAQRIAEILDFDWTLFFPKKKKC